MKKVVIILFILICLTGCKKTYLTCSKVITNEQTIKVEETIELGYKRKKLDTSTKYIDYLFKSNVSINKESIRVELQKECDSYKGIDGVECKVYDIDDKVRLELKLKIDKLSDADKEKFEYMLDYGNYTETFRKLEKEYICG